MSSDSVLRLTTRVAAVALAATAGALLGFGLRLGAPAALYSAAGDRLRGVPGFVTPDRAFHLSASLGALHHAALVVAWSIVFTLAARRRRGGALVVAAIVAAIAIVTLDVLLPTPLRVAGGAMTPGQRVVYGGVLAAALAFGMRLAQHEGGST